MHLKKKVKTGIISNVTSVPKILNLLKFLPFGSCFKGFLLCLCHFFKNLVGLSIQIYIFIPIWIFYKPEFLNNSFGLNCD